MFLRNKSPDKLAALGATMATDEVDFAEQPSDSSFSEGSRDMRLAPDRP